jgi:hypothetical protein
MCITGLNGIRLTRLSRGVRGTVTRLLLRGHLRCAVMMRAAAVHPGRGRRHALKHQTEHEQNAQEHGA